MSRAGEARSGVDLLYADPALAAVYDAAYGWDRERAHYLALAGDEPARVLDAGCGPGLLAVAFARAGHRTVGLDPGAGNLDFAKARDDGDLVEWHRETLDAFRWHEPFDLIVMTGNAFQCILDETALDRTLSNVRSLLAPAGCFAFETRNPQRRAWEGWTPDGTSRSGMTADGVPFVFHTTLQRVDGRFVTFDKVIDLGDPPRRLVSRSTLRFWTFKEIEASAMASGLVVASAEGDWDGEPVTPVCDEFVLTLKRGVEARH